MTASVARGRVLVLPSFLRDWRRAEERVEVLGLIGISAETVEVPPAFRSDVFAELDAVERKPLMQQYIDSAVKALTRVDLVMVDNRRSETNQACRWEHAVGPRAMEVVSAACRWTVEDVTSQEENEKSVARKKLVEDTARLFPPRWCWNRAKPVVLLYTPRFDDYGRPEDCKVSDVYLRHRALEELNVPALDGKIGEIRTVLQRIRKVRSGRSRNGQAEVVGQSLTEATVPDVEVTVSM